jgi:hypothetical protein
MNIDMVVKRIRTSIKEKEREYSNDQSKTKVTEHQNQKTGMVRKGKRGKDTYDLCRTSC